jgi:hypothetical protein
VPAAPSKEAARARTRTWLQNQRDQTAKLEHQAAIKIGPKYLAIGFTRWVRPGHLD